MNEKLQYDIQIFPQNTDITGLFYVNTKYHEM